MGTMMRFGVPIVLGLIAMGINWMVLESKLVATDYVVVIGKIKAGQPFKRENLRKFPLRGIDGSLKGTALRYDQISMIQDTPCARDLMEGDLVLLRDSPATRKDVYLQPDERSLQIDLDSVKYEPELLVVGAEIGFVYAQLPVKTEATPPGGATPPPSSAADLKPFIEGPFRIVAIGRRVNLHAEGFQNEHSGQRIISIAIKTEPGEKLDLKTARLLQNARLKLIQSVVQFPQQR